MKRKTAKEILAESFRELAGSKQVDKITVPDIVENCGYSKTTFYRLFKDKYELMAWITRKGFRQSWARPKKRIMRGSKFFGMSLCFTTSRKSI